jgi:hypothetical protein
MRTRKLSILGSSQEFDNVGSGWFRLACYFLSALVIIVILFPDI